MNPLLIIKPLVELGSGWLKGRQLKQQQKHEIVKAQTEAQIKKIHDDDDRASDLDQYFVKNHGLTQMISFYIFIAPAILVFVGYEEEVTRGFDALMNMPLWYQYTLGGMLIAIWGYRRVLNALIQKKMTKFIAEKPFKNGHKNV